jgi:hypothetical protein
MAEAGKPSVVNKKARKAKVSVAFVGEDVQTLARLAQFAESLPASISLHADGFIPDYADAIVFLLDHEKCAASPKDSLRVLVEALVQSLAKWGRRLTPGQRPFFVALHNWEKQVVAMTVPDALEWLENRKAELFQQLVAALSERRIKLEGGFGSVNCRFWAVSLAEPTDLPDSYPLARFGVAPLLEETLRSAHEFHSRTARQRILLPVMALACVAVLIAATAGLWRLATRWQHVLRSHQAQPDDPTTFLPPTERLAWWTDRGRRLLRWEDWRRGHALVLDWPGWIAEVHRFRQASGQLPKPSTSEAEPLVQALMEVTHHLTRVQERALLLGAHGDQQGFSDNSVEHSGALAFVPTIHAGPSGTREAFDNFLAELEERLARAQRDFPIAWADREPLPGDLPLEVAEDLRQLAESRYRAVLEPVRAEIRRNVLRLGDGKETYSAWRECVQHGWLSGAARRELAHWLSVVQLLQCWAGRQAVDPLDELTQLVLQEQIPLPLGRLFLLWPAHVSPLSVLAGKSPSDLNFPEPPAELKLIFLSPGEPETVLSYQRVGSSPLAASEIVPGIGLHLPADGRTTIPNFRGYGQSPRYEYRLVTHVAWPGECYAYRPGVAIRIWGRVHDSSGRAWQVSWSEREARSQVFGFTTLELTPRCHSTDQPPESGDCLPGVRLQLSVPLPLPDLLP